MVYPIAYVYASPVALRKTLSINFLHVWAKFLLGCFGGESNAQVDNFAEERNRSEAKKHQAASSSPTKYSPSSHFPLCLDPHFPYVSHSSWCQCRLR